MLNAQARLQPHGDEVVARLAVVGNDRLHLWWNEVAVHREPISQGGSVRGAQRDGVVRTDRAFMQHHDAAAVGEEAAWRGIVPRHRARQPAAGIWLSALQLG